MTAYNLHLIPTPPTSPTSVSSPQIHPPQQLLFETKFKLSDNKALTFSFGAIWNETHLFLGSLENIQQMLTPKSSDRLREQQEKLYVVYEQIKNLLHGHGVIRTKLQVSSKHPHRAVNKTLWLLQCAFCVLPPTFSTQAPSLIETHPRISSRCEHKIDNLLLGATHMVSSPQTRGSGGS